MSTDRVVTTSAATSPRSVTSSSRYSASSPPIARQSSRRACETSLKMTCAPRSSAPSPISPSPQPTSRRTSPGSIRAPSSTRSRTGASRSNRARRASADPPVRRDRSQAAQWSVTSGGGARELQLFVGPQQAGDDDADGAQQRDTDADPAPVVGHELLRDRDQPDDDEDGRERAQGDDHEALGHSRGQLDAKVAQDAERDDGCADAEHELPEHACVPADHRNRGAAVRADVPAHERREHQDDARDPGQPAAPRPRTATGAGGGDLLLLNDRWRRFHGSEYGRIG